MRRNKIGAMFLVSTLALAGVGVSYAGFSDYVKVYGQVDTATVTLTLYDYSGTIVWKIWEPFGQMFTYPGLDILMGAELAIYRGFNHRTARTEIEALFTSNNWRFEYEASADAHGSAMGYSNEVDMIFDNVFPPINFFADFVMAYDGTIPAKITGVNFFNTYTDPSGIVSSGFDFTPYLSYEIHKCEPDGSGGYIIGPTILDPIGLQLHDYHYIYVVVKLKLIQDNALQGLTGYFTMRLDVLQWFD